MGVRSDGGELPATLGTPLDPLCGWVPLAAAPQAGGQAHGGREMSLWRLVLTGAVVKDKHLPPLQLITTTLQM